MDVLIFTEFEPGRLGGGVKRRLDHYLDHFESLSATPRVIPLFPGPGPSFEQSARAAREAAARPEVERCDEVVFLGVGSVPLLRGALAAVRRARGTVVFDQCDSLVTQLLTAVGARNHRLVVFGLMRALLVGTGSRRLVLDYIDRRDLRRDVLFNMGRRTRLIGISAPGALAGMAPVDLDHIERIVVPGDFSSGHLSRGMQALQQAASGGVRVRVDYFGPHPPDWMPAGGVYNGFAPELEDLYRGNTAVFIPNVGGGGVPNKLYEAAVSGRPVIAHTSIIDRVSVPLIGWRWRHAAELEQILRTLGGPDAVAPCPLH